MSKKGRMCFYLDKSNIFFHYCKSRSHPVGLWEQACNNTIDPFGAEPKSSHSPEKSTYFLIGS